MANIDWESGSFSAPQTEATNWDSGALTPPPRKRTLAALANDTVIEVANAAAGGVSAAANFIKPGNAISSAIDRNIIQAGEANQSDAVKAAKQTFRQDVAQADGPMQELGAVGRYVVDNPLLSGAQALGSFVGPGMAVKGGNAAARLAGASAQNVARGGLAGGAAAGAAMAGGDAAGTAYDLASKAGATEEQAVQAGRNSSVIPAVIGGASGLVGAERLFAGGKGFAGNAASRAIKTGLVEGGGEAVEEGVTQYEGQRAAMPYDKTIDPTKGVAAAAGMGAALGGITGAGTSLLTGGHGQAAAAPGGQQLNPADDPSVGAPAAAPQAQATPPIDPTAGPLSKAAATAQTMQAAAVPGPSPAPAPAAAPALSEAALAGLSPEDQREARILAAELQRADLPTGVRNFNQARLNELVPPRFDVPEATIPQDMPQRNVRRTFDARDQAAPVPAWANELSSEAVGQGAQPVARRVDTVGQFVDSGGWDALKQDFLTSGAQHPQQQAVDQALATLRTGDPAVPTDARLQALATVEQALGPQLQAFENDRATDPRRQLDLVPNGPATYEGGIDFEPTPGAASGRPPAGPSADQQAIARLALAENIEPGSPLALNRAHALRRAAAAEGIAMSVVPHPSGRGYDVAPTARLDPAARAATPQDEGAASLPFDSSNSGRMVAGQQGVRTEARAEAVARANEQQQARLAVEAERERRAALGLSNITPVTPTTEAGNPALPRVTFDTGPTGRMVAGADGVRAETNADRINRAQQAQQPQENASAPQTDQAQQAQSQQPQAPAPAPEVAARNPSWRRNAMAANKVARELGIETRGKNLAAVVAEIDARDQQDGQQDGTAPAGLQRTTATQLDTPGQGVLANATAQKKAAFERVKTLRAQVKDGRADLRVKLIRAEDAHREALRNEQDARAQLEREANRQGETLQRGTTTAAPPATSARAPQAAQAVEESSPGRRELPSGVADDPASEYSSPDGRAQEPTQPDDGTGPTTGRARGAAGERVRGDGGVVPRRTASLVGLGIADRIQQAGSQALIGQRVDSPQRLAELAQVFRDPRFETFRVFLIKDGQVVHSTGVSSRLPGETPTQPAGMTRSEYLQEFRDNMQRTGADSYYVLHNHPSGNPTPSRADIEATTNLAAHVPGMLAHVVINSNKYAVIDAKNHAGPLGDMVQYHDFGEEKLLKASKPMAILGTHIDGPEGLAIVGKSTQRPGWITLIGTGADGNVRAVSEAPASILTRSYPYLAATVRRFQRLSGSGSVFVVGEAGDISSKPVRSALAAGIITDALPDIGQTLRLQGAEAGSEGFSNTKGRNVAPGAPAATKSASNADTGTRVKETPTAYSERIGDAVKGLTVTNIKKHAGYKASDYMGLGLQFLGRRQLVDVYGNMLPQMQTYSDLMAQMDADKNEAGAGADELATAWGKLPDERQLAELMHDATRAQIDPSKAFVPGDNQTDWTSLQRRYNALSPAAKDIYARARDMYSEHSNQVRSAIKERIERSGMGGERKNALLKRMDEEFFGRIKGVYFPLARFGQYVVVVKDREGKAVNVSRAETMAEAEEARQALRTPFPASQGFTVGKVLKAKEFQADRDTVGRGFMEQLYGVLEKQGMEAKQRAELEDALGQLYLSSMPDLSWAKHGIHRKGTAGFSQDARRAFAQNVFHGARYLAKLRYSDQLQDQLTEMDKHVSARDDAPGYDSVRARQVVDEMNKRHDSAMNPMGNPLSTALTSAGFIFHLGLSPASAMVNLTQTALVAYPVMGAKWGFTKAGNALLQASKEAALNKNDITGALNADEKAAYDEAVRAGVIDVTMAHDLAGIAQGEDAGVMWKLRPVMKAASWMFHHAEKFNRQVTFVASYRLARQAGADQKTAYADAVKATYDGHFDYSSNNRPRVMQGNAARVLLLFKQYGQNMVYTLVRNAQQSLKGATPKERTDARKALAGLLTMHGLAAGALGLPMVTTLLAAASMIGGSDDEPWDAQVALQNMLADALGQKPAEVLAHGLSRLTPWDISGRVGLDKLIFPDVQEGLEGQRLAESAMTAALGPVAGIGVNALKGVQALGEGQYLRGLESMLPTVLRSPMKAIRYGSEGVKDKTGIVVQDEVGAAELLGQAAGFSPSSVRNSFAGKSAIVQHDRALQARRSALVEQFAMAAMAGDEAGKAEAREAVAAFNEKNPTRRIQAMQLAQSVNQRQKRIREAQDGVYLPSKRRADAMEAGRFAVPD